MSWLLNYELAFRVLKIFRFRIWFRSNAAVFSPFFSGVQDRRGYHRRVERWSSRICRGFHNHMIFRRHGPTFVRHTMQPFWLLHWNVPSEIQILRDPNSLAIVGQSPLCKHCKLHCGSKDSDSLCYSSPDVFAFFCVFVSTLSRKQIPAPDAAT